MFTKPHADLNVKTVIILDLSKCNINVVSPNKIIHPQYFGLGVFFCFASDRCRKVATKCITKASNDMKHERIA